MSTIAIGDIHGNLQALEDLLGRIGPDVHSDDTVVFLGDYIDRGPESRGCVERILDFQKAAAGTVVTLMGNHEQWFLLTYRDYAKHSWILGMEGFETIRSYSPDAEMLLRREFVEAGRRLVTGHVTLSYDIFFKTVPKEHIDFFKNLSTYCRTPDALCVHAGLNPNVGPVEIQNTEDLIWGHSDFPERYDGRDIVLYGHTDKPVMDADGWPNPRILGKTCGLDTIGAGVLTAFKLPEKKIIQSGRYS